MNHSPIPFAGLMSESVMQTSIFARKGAERVLTFAPGSRAAP
jgi:hypothetical protein